jgi:hypothetical protein
LFQGLRKLWQKAISVPAGLWREACGAVGCLVILVQDKVRKGAAQAQHISHWGALGGVSGWRIAGEIAQQPLIDRVEKALNATAAWWLTDLRENRADLEVSTDLLQVLRAKI